MNKKKATFIVSFIGMALAISSVSVISLSDGKAVRTVINTFSSAKISIAVQENDDGNTDPDIENTLTWEETDGGYTATKKVEVVNIQNDESNVSAYIRVCIVPSLYTTINTSSEESITVNVSNNVYFDGFGSLTDIVIDDSQYTMGDLTFNLNPEWNTYWTFNPADGYFYYKEAVSPGGTTKPLLESVYITSGLYKSMTEQGVNLQVDILADSQYIPFSILEDSSTNT